MRGEKTEFTDYLLFWLRWLGVIPIAVVAALLSMFPVHFVVVSTFDSDFIQLSENGLRVVEYAGYAFAFPIAFIWGGSWVAPAGRPHVVAILAMLWVCAVGLLYLYLLVLSNDDHIEWDTLRATASILLGAIGIGVGGTTAHRRWIEKA